jgi:hypothetical protein
MRMGRVLLCCLLISGCAKSRAQPSGKAARLLEIKTFSAQQLNTMRQEDLQPLLGQRIMVWGFMHRFRDSTLTFHTRNEATGTITPLKSPTCIFPDGQRPKVDREPDEKEKELEVEGTLGLEKNKVVLTACQVY